MLIFKPPLFMIAFVQLF